MLEEILNELKARSQKAIDSLVAELSTIHAGRASPALLNNITVVYQNSLAPLQQIAGISVVETNLIVIQPWDRMSLRDIERAILKANIGLNPSNDGNIIRVVIPPLSEERRKELAKLVSQRVEERRLSLRNIRRDGIEKLRRMEKNKDISQDELKNNIKIIDQLTEIYISKITEIGKSKAKEIQEV